MNTKLAEKKIKYQQDFETILSPWKKMCNFLSVVRAIELYLDTLFSLQEIKSCFKDLVAVRQIKPNGSLDSPSAYLSMGYYLGKLRDKPLKIYQVGFLRDNQPIAWDGSEAEFNFVQLKFRTAISPQHWTLGGKDAVEVFDPWNGPIEKVELVKQYLLKIVE